MTAKHTWKFKARFRARALGWRGSRPGCRRLKEAVSEIKKVARVDPVAAADGVVSLMEKIWPAFEHVDTSSGALGGAVNWAQGELLPIVIQAPADQETRDKWLDLLWQAIQEDGVDYLWMVQDRWGELCGSRETAALWADELIGLLRTAWSDPRPGNYVTGTTLRLSSLVAAGRHQELFAVLALDRYRCHCKPRHRTANIATVYRQVTLFGVGLFWVACTTNTGWRKWQHDARMELLRSTGISSARSSAPCSNSQPFR